MARGSAPATRTSPDQGAYRPPARCIRLLLPAPVRPTSATCSPARTLKETPCSTRRSATRSEEHTSELQSLMRISYAIFCLKKKHIEITMTKQMSEYMQIINIYKYKVTIT